MTASAHALELLKVAAAAADSKAGEDLVAIDVSHPLPLADIFLIVTGRSERNVVAIAGEIEDKLIEAGYKPLRREGRAEGRWILVDFGDLVVHVFHEEERVYYSLERLWKDCPVIPIELASARAIEPVDVETAVEIETAD
jgi:ribosome-associated protein